MIIKINNIDAGLTHSLYSFPFNGISFRNLLFRISKCQRMPILQNLKIEMKTKYITVEGM